MPAPIISHEAAPQIGARAGLADRFGRRIDYVRMSVTDRCDLRCTYCMAETMRFVPRNELLSLAELENLGMALIGLGVRRLRITGGEPLVRGGVTGLIARLGRQLGQGLDEITITTNGMTLARHAQALADAGVRRINVSLDSLDPARFARITRWGDLGRVMGGIAAAQQAGLRLKINMVALLGQNDDEFLPMLRWCARIGADLCFIETMPMGEVGIDRSDQYLPLAQVRAQLAAHYTLTDVADRTAGPARYARVAETGQRVGFITPMSHNFCHLCNRVRLSATGRLYLCLGHEDSVDLRAVLRGGGGGDVAAALIAAMDRKPLGHDFQLNRAEARFMSVTGG